MIVSRRSGGPVVVMQTDHQEQCAAMARAWGNEQFARLDHWDDVVLAAALHDEGWRRWEADPPAGADGGPVDFPDVPRDEHVALYREGIAVASARSERAGLLVSMHGSGLYEARFGLGGAPPPAGGHRPVVRRFLDAQDRWRADVLQRLGSGAEEWAWDAYRLLQAWDAFSLYLVWRALPAGRSGALRGVPRGPGDAEGVTIEIAPIDGRPCRLAPWPFAGAEVCLPVRTHAVRGARGGEAFREDYVAVAAESG